MMRLIVLTFVVGVVPLPRFSFAQIALPDDGLSISVTHIDSIEHGFQITVKIANLSRHPLFLPQSSDWPNFKDRSQIYSLDLEQWSDGKTNLSPIGKKLPRVGFLSVAPCRDAVGAEGWIRLAPGKHVSDQIQTFEPSSVDYGNSACPLRMARLADKLRVSVTAYRSAHLRTDKRVSTWTDFLLPPH
jgi:hypothetical protein